MQSENNRQMPLNMTSSSFIISSSNSRNFENQAVSEAVLKWSSLG